MKSSHAKSPRPSAAPGHSRAAVRPKPVAPAVYRPQPGPRCLQLKSPPGANAGTQNVPPPASPPRAAAPRAPVAPPVYRPERKGIAQPKTASAAQARVTPKAPPVYRPQAKPSAQPPTRPVQMKPRQAAPHAHQCQPACKAVQPKAPVGSGVAPAQGRGVKAAAGRTNPPAASTHPRVRQGSPDFRGRPAVVQRKQWQRAGNILKSLEDDQTLNVNQGPSVLEEGEVWNDVTGEIWRPDLLSGWFGAENKAAYDKEHAWTEANIAARSVGLQLRTNPSDSSTMAAKIIEAALDISKTVVQKSEGYEQKWKTEVRPFKPKDKGDEEWLAKDIQKVIKSGKEKLAAAVKKALDADNPRNALADVYGFTISSQYLSEGNNRFTYIVLLILSTYLGASLPSQDKMKNRSKVGFKPQEIANQFLGMYDDDDNNNNNNN
jgi:hypothetical protein